MYLFIKRTVDIIGSFCGLVILSPLLLIVAILIKIDSKGPVIFKQQRIGKNGKVFDIYKFRSMCVGAEKTGTGVYSGSNDVRVTKVGKIIRATSIDELPQLVNILKGEMSIVGPRPVLTYHPWSYDQYTEQQLKRFSVRPGVTGWAQINGRKEIDWDTRLEFDCEYVEKISAFFDIKILFMTVIKVFTNADNVNTTVTVTNDESKDEQNAVKVNVSDKQ